MDTSILGQLKSITFQNSVPTVTYSLNFASHMIFRKIIIYTRCSVHLNTRLKNSKKMQQYADIYLLLNYCTCFGRPSRPSPGVRKTVVAASGTDHTVGEQASSNVSGSLILRQYDLYQRLQLQSYVPLMMGEMDARNMYSNIAVNKYLHTHFNYTN